MSGFLSTRALFRASLAACSLGLVCPKTARQQRTSNTSRFRTAFPFQCSQIRCSDKLVYVGPRGVRTPARRVHTHVNALVDSFSPERSHECERGTHECVRHVAI